MYGVYDIQGLRVLLCDQIFRPRAAFGGSRISFRWLVSPELLRLSLAASAHISRHCTPHQGPFDVVHGSGSGGVIALIHELILQHILPINGTRKTKRIDDWARNMNDGSFSRYLSCTLVTASIPVNQLFRERDPVRIGSPLMRSTSQGEALTLKAQIQSIKCNYKCGMERENKECQFEGRNQQRNQPTDANHFSHSLICITFVSQLCNNSVLVRSQKSHSQPVKSLTSYHFLGLSQYCGNYVLTHGRLP